MQAITHKLEDIGIHRPYYNGFHISQIRINPVLLEPGLYGLLWICFNFRMRSYERKQKLFLFHITKAMDTKEGYGLLLQLKSSSSRNLILRQALKSPGV